LSQEEGNDVGDVDKEKENVALAELSRDSGSACEPVSARHLGNTKAGIRYSSARGTG
jgi:hypothetical protein